MKIFIGLFLLLMTSAANATTWYVSSSYGNDAFTGTSLGTPFLTLQQAANSTAAGDTVYVVGGFYGGGVGGKAALTIAISGTGAGTTPGTPCTNQIVYSAYPGTHPIVSGARDFAAIVGVNPLSCITINGFEVAGDAGSLTFVGGSQNAGAGGTSWQNPAYTNDGIGFAGTTGGTGSTSVHHIIISNNTVHDFPAGGIDCNYCDYVTVTGNTVYNNSNYSPFAGSGISLFELHNIDAGTGTKNWVVNNTTYNNINLVPDHFSIIASTFGNGTTTTGNTTINVISSAGVNYTAAVLDTLNGCIPPNTTVSSFGTGFIILSQAITCNITGSSGIQVGYITDGEGVIIDDNNNGQSDSVPYVGRTLVENNVVFGNGNSGLEAGTSRNVDFVFNTVFQDQQSFNNSVAAGAGLGELGVAAGTGMNIYNNVLYAPSSLVPSCWDQSGSATVWSNNVCYNGSGAHAIPGSNNVLTDPLLVSPTISPTSANLQLLPGSPAAGAGSGTFSRTTDIAGNPGIFLALPDIGAYAQPCSSYGTYAYLQTPGIGAACRSR